MYRLHHCVGLHSIKARIRAVSMYTTPRRNLYDAKGRMYCYINYYLRDLLSSDSIHGMRIEGVYVYVGGDVYTAIRYCIQ